MDTDRNLIFGVLALQADLIDSVQFVEACTRQGLWTEVDQEIRAVDSPAARDLIGRGHRAQASAEEEHIVEETRFPEGCACCG